MSGFARSLRTLRPARHFTIRRALGPLRLASAPLVVAPAFCGVASREARETHASFASGVAFGVGAGRDSDGGASAPPCVEPGRGAAFEADASVRGRYPGRNDIVRHGWTEKRSTLSGLPGASWSSSPLTEQARERDPRSEMCRIESLVHIERAVWHEMLSCRMARH